MAPFIGSSSRPGLDVQLQLSPLLSRARRRSSSPTHARIWGTLAALSPSSPPEIPRSPYVLFTKISESLQRKLDSPPSSISRHPDERAVSWGPRPYHSPKSHSSTYTHPFELSYDCYQPT